MLRLQIVTTAKTIAIETNEEGVLLPDMLRCADVSYDGAMCDNFFIRMISIKSYWFYIIIPCGFVTKKRYEKFINGFKDWRMHPGVLVSPIDSVIEIPVEKTTYMHEGLIRYLKKAARE